MGFLTRQPVSSSSDLPQFIRTAQKAPATVYAKWRRVGGANPPDVLVVVEMNAAIHPCSCLGKGIGKGPSNALCFEG